MCVILILGVCAALALRASKGGGGKGKGKGKNCGYGHTDFWPLRYTYHPVAQYPHVYVNQPANVHRPVTIRQPYTTYENVLMQRPVPWLINKPVVDIPNTTFQQVWVYPRYKEEIKKGWWFCSKGKGKGSTKSKGSQKFHPHHYYRHQQPHHYPAPVYPHHHSVPTYGSEWLPTVSPQATSYCYATSICSHTTSHSATGR